MAVHSSILAGESQGRGSLVGCCLWGRTESDPTEACPQQQQQSHHIISLRNNFYWIFISQNDRCLAWAYRVFDNFDFDSVELSVRVNLDTTSLRKSTLITSWHCVPHLPWRRYSVSWLLVIYWLLNACIQCSVVIFKKSSKMTLILLLDCISWPL